MSEIPGEQSAGSAVPRSGTSPGSTAATTHGDGALGGVEPECVCGEINTRHCPVHGQGEVESAASVDPLREAFVMMHQAVDVLLDQAVTDKFKTQRAVVLRSEALRLASLRSPLVEAAEETLRVLGPHRGAHEGEWYPCLARLRDALKLVRSV